MDDIKKMLYNNKISFTKYIKDHNTSYDGYIPSGTNVFDDYIKSDDFEAFELTQIIDFYIKSVLNN